MAKKLTHAKWLALQAATSNKEPYQYPIKAPDLMRGVVPDGVVPPVAMDSSAEVSAAYAFAQASSMGQGFPGYAYLAQLTARPEYRAMAAAYSTELTREWISFDSSETEDETVKDRIALIEAAVTKHGLQDIIARAATHDCWFGRGQIFVNIRGHDRASPLVLAKQTIAKGSLIGFKNVEPMWVTPSAYNALDPAAPDFYKPTKWFMLGKETHASRLLTVVTREMPDMLKPAFNFSGISLSQLAEPYVDNWLRTRQSVSDLLNNFSTSVLATDMSQVLSGDDDAASDLFDRAMLFTATRSNKGLMLVDREREELVQINTPLSGLHELQAQSQEHMCAVSRVPAMILTGISPSGLNASSDGEIRAWYDWIAANQVAHWQNALDTMIKVIMLSEFGFIDEAIKWKWNPLWQMDAVEESQIRLNDANTATAYIGAGVIDPSEVRDKLARSSESGYAGIESEVMPDVEDI